MRLIDADALTETIKKQICGNCDNRCESGMYCGEWALMKLIEAEQTVDAVPVKSIEQFKWERDTAIQQLEEHGIPFCGKADVVAVVRCKECAKRGTLNCDLDYCGYRQADNWYCADGERKDDA